MPASSLSTIFCSLSDLLFESPELRPVNHDEKMLILLQGIRQVAASQDRAVGVDVLSRVVKHDPRLHERVRCLIKRGVIEKVIAHRFTQALGASIGDSISFPCREIGLPCM